MKKLNLFRIALVITTSLLLLIVGCGGGGGSDPAPDNTDNPQNQSNANISGTASKGQIRDGAIAAYAIDEQGRKVLPALATGTTGSDGGYTLAVNHSGPVLVEVTSGTYTDEATRAEIQIDAPLRAVRSAVTEDVQIAVTPLTEIAVRIAEAGGGLSPDKIDAANALLSQLLGTTADVLASQPIDPTDTAAFSAATADAQNYGLLLAGISKMADTRGQSAMDIVKAIEKDLLDLKIDRTGAELAASIQAFDAAGDSDLGDILAQILAAGLKPTGTLSEAKKLLSDFMKAPSEAGYDALITYLDTFTPSSKASYLFKAIASLMHVYDSSAAQFIIGDPDGWNLDVDPQRYNADRLTANLLASATVSGDVQGLLTEITDSLDKTYADLEQAEGVNAIMTFTGMDTIYFDDIDIKILKAITKSIQAIFLLPQAVNLNAHDWNVPDGSGGTVDARDLINAKQGLSEVQNSAILAANPDLFSYSDASKLEDVKTAISQAASDLAAAVSDLEALGAKGREKRIHNALNIDSELQFYMLKASSEHTLTSLQAALADPATTIVTIRDTEVDWQFITDEDGHQYYQTEHEIYLVPQQPSGSTITLYDLFSGNKSVRDFIQEAIAGGEPYEPYVEGTPTLYKDGVLNTDWDSAW